MDAERWRQIDTVFKSALDVPTAERAAFIERACAGDEALRAGVLSLVAHDRTDFLDEPVPEEAARVLAARSERALSLAGHTVGPYRVLSRTPRRVRRTPDSRAVCHIDTRRGVSNVVCPPPRRLPPQRRLRRRPHQE